LPHVRRLRDLRTGAVATTDRLALHLDPVAPAILAVEDGR
jgi:hypothetical protein